MRARLSLVAALLVLLPRLALAQTTEATDANQALAEALQATARLAEATRSSDPEVVEAARKAQAALAKASEAIKTTPLHKPPPTMDRTTFTIFVDDLKLSERSNPDKLSLIERAARRHQFSVDQVMTLMRLFVRGDDRVEVCARVYHRIEDPENFGQVYSLLTFASEKRALALRVSR